MDWVTRVNVVIWTADRNLQKLARDPLSESAQVFTSLQYLLEYHQVVII